jgi:hypothetical protein
MFLGTAHAQPSTTPAAAAKPGATFDSLSLRIGNALPDGSTTTMTIKGDGSYEVTTAGNMAHFIAIDAQGQLSAPELASLQNALAKVQKADPPANLPGLVPGSSGFTISWSQAGKQGSTGGSTNIAGALQDAKQQGLDASAWTAVAPLFKKLDSLESSVEQSSKAPAAAPDKKPFDDLTFKWTDPNIDPRLGNVTTLAVKADGSYTLERPLGQSTLTGTLTPAQLKSIVASYDPSNIQRDAGYSVSGANVTIVADQGGKSYTVQGIIPTPGMTLNGEPIVPGGDFVGLMTALESVSNQVQPSVAHPPTLDGKDDTVGRPSRTPGMSSQLQGLVEQGAAKSDGKDAVDGGK